MPKTVSEMPGCEGCPMRKLFPKNNFIPPQMANPTRDSGRIQIGEAPGEDESISGIPFSGGAGRWRDRMLQRAGITKDTVTTANVMCCRPPKNIFPTDSDARSYISAAEGLAAVRHCVRSHLLPLLRSRAWKRVDLLGAKALRFVGMKDESIYEHRGSAFDINIEELEKSVA